MRVHVQVACSVRAASVYIVSGRGCVVRCQDTLWSKGVDIHRYRDPMTRGGHRTDPPPPTSFYELEEKLIEQPAASLSSALD